MPHSKNRSGENRFCFSGFRSNAGFVGKHCAGKTISNLNRELPNLTLFSVNERRAKSLEVCTPKDGDRQLISSHCRLFIFKDMRSLHRVVHCFRCNRR
jgi:hypothetical protein